MHVKIISTPKEMEDGTKSAIYREPQKLTAMGVTWVWWQYG